MEVLRPDETARAAALLREGRLVAFPTETVYGLGAWAREPLAVRRVFEAKGRPAGHPLIVHLPDAAALDEWTEAGPVAHLLAERFWPGPLTLVVPRRPIVPDEVTGGRDTVGVRVPDHPVALAMLRDLGSGVAAPSANRFGHVSPTTAAHVIADLAGRIDAVIDGGPCPVGVESTIVEVVGPVLQILRPGGISADELEDAARVGVQRIPTGPSRAPGMLTVHYAPRARVVIVDAVGGDSPSAAAHQVAAELAAAGHRIAVLAPEPIEGLGLLDGVIELAPAGPPAHYARVLYARLREADDRGADVVVCVAPPAVGVGVAVRDRLARAAGA